jgi:D-glycero-alpha-D-manno-heptose 1-phosphate guanylyltransferase
VVEKEPLGTGGGIRLALEQCQNSSVFIINGDTYFKVNLQKLSDFYFQQNAKCALALKKLQKVDRYGNVELENEKIVAFKEKEFREETIINGGIYCLNKSALDDFEAGSKFSFEKDFLEIDTAKQAFFGLCFDDYFMDIGIPTDYHQFSKDVLS